MRLMRKQVTLQSARYEQQQAFQQELLKQNEKLRKKNKIDALRIDVRALYLDSEDMDWLFFSNNLLVAEVVAVSLPSDFKVLKEMLEGRRDQRAHLI
ncbi:hypothetical protein PVK06_002759 [Gossypium arboreum]|uniref:Uncharacterized protein n=1 Tax=Gossypium arboreum TaxID=29729 RepID=A0ABR0R5L4_GOSAR|nr:hypothetical protein PVK06_002759 [Gossypium arboreum]